MRKNACDALWEYTCKFPNFASGFGICVSAVTGSRQQNRTRPKAQVQVQLGGQPQVFVAMLGHDLGNHLVLAFDLVFQGRYGLLGFAYKTGVGLFGKRRGSILKEDFLPLIKLRGIDLMHFADLREPS